MKAMILLSKNYEEVEALTVVDYLRRAEIDIDLVATEGDLETIGDHGIKIIADKLIEDIDVNDYDLVITPGGMGGSEALAKNKKVTDLLQAHYQKNQGYIASICASPLVLAEVGIAKDIEGTVFPGLEDQVNFKTYKSQDLVVNDKKNRVITSQGPGTAIYFALEIIAQVKGKEAMIKVAQGLLVPKIHQQIKLGKYDI